MHEVMTLVCQELIEAEAAQAIGVAVRAARVSLSGDPVREDD